MKEAPTTRSSLARSYGSYNSCFCTAFPVSVLSAFIMTPLAPANGTLGQDYRGTDALGHKYPLFGVVWWGWWGGGVVDLLASRSYATDGRCLSGLQLQKPVMEEYSPEDIFATPRPRAPQPQRQGQGGSRERGRGRPVGTATTTPRGSLAGGARRRLDFSDSDESPAGAWTTPRTTPTTTPTTPSPRSNVAVVPFHRGGKTKQVRIHWNLTLYSSEEEIPYCSAGLGNVRVRWSLTEFVRVRVRQTGEIPALASLSHSTQTP